MSSAVSVSPSCLTPLLPAPVRRPRRPCSRAAFAAPACATLPVRLSPPRAFSEPAAAAADVAQLAATGWGSPSPSPAAAEVVQLAATGWDTPAQLLYLSVLLSFLGAGSFLVVRQVLLRRELEAAAKELGERVRSGSASAEELYEYGVVLLRKKVYSSATKSLEAALAAWPADAEGGEGLAAVHNALGYALAGQERAQEALAQFRAAVALQPGYVTAWNNLGDALEKQKLFAEALQAYSQALVYEPANGVALERYDFLKSRRLGM